MKGGRVSVCHWSLMHCIGWAALLEYLMDATLKVHSDYWVSWPLMFYAHTEERAEISKQWQVNKSARHVSQDSVLCKWGMAQVYKATN